jgi:hypothetical protein
MEKELEELSVFFEDKKDVINIIIATLNNNYINNDDIIRMIIVNYLY